MNIKKLMTIFLAAVMTVSLSACGEANGEGEAAGAAPAAPAETAAAETPGAGAAEAGTAGEAAPAAAETAAPGGKILVAYFSATGNTAAVAKTAAERLGADLFEIVPAVPYSAADLDYRDAKSRSSVENADPKARPAVAGTVADMNAYGAVLIGYPIWWGKAPRVVSTFVESYDFTGKKLVAFATSASSPFGSSDADLRAAAAGATWLDGRRFPEKPTDAEVTAWADGLGLK